VLGPAVLTKKWISDSLDGGREGVFTPRRSVLPLTEVDAPELRVERRSRPAPASAAMPCWRQGARTV
jgi:hypothetical protein